MSAGFFNLKRPIHEMPDFVKQTLEKRCLTRACKDRPAYQQNDYLGWICRAKRAETQVKRLTQMRKLEMGGLYMKMKYTPSTKL